MPGRYYGRRRRMAPVINSIKNVVDSVIGVTTTLASTTVVKAVTSPSPTVNSDVSHGCIVKAIWASIDVCGLAGTGVRQRIGMYLMKIPGANLTVPGVFVVGTSNEKKFVIKQWSYMTMRNQDGNAPNHWEGWIKIPKRYHRMGTDDIWQLVVASDSSTGHYSAQFIYKWYR